MASPKLLDLIIAAGPLSFLKSHGFRKKGRAFYKYLGPVFQYVHFFPSFANSSEVAAFTLQIGSTLPFRHPKVPETMITELWPIIGRRFGPDLDHPIGQFWFADTIQPTANEVVERLENHVMPFFAQHSSEEKLRQWWIDAGSMMQGPTTTT